ncbi:DUF1275 domain-containing protein [Escherichia coli]|nr:DUF1275 domain-containing protein [Escherichia coli]EFH6939170.1 DUF1275 domain-containing protein [Escherichia coli]EFJ0002019.1 DUF1275 domain-containing protein [Escherichia coli]EFN2288776.1 DUF1275 domain-containing protein [Escherichia coli]ELO5254491.1 DUF1275 domain-containing protein [Escherichia coli]
MKVQSRLYILWILTLVGGFCDSSTFVMQDIFTGHITGNTILAIVYLMQTNWNMFILCALSLFFPFWYMPWKCISIALSRRSPNLSAYSLIIGTNHTNFNWFSLMGDR